MSIFNSAIIIWKRLSNAVYYRLNKKEIDRQWAEYEAWLDDELESYHNGEIS